MIKENPLSEDKYGPITDWAAEEAKSTLKEHERRHFWEQLEQIEQGLRNGFKPIKSIVQNPMSLKGEDLNNLIEETSDFIQKTRTIQTFLTQMVRYIDKKIPNDGGEVCKS